MKISLTFFFVVVTMFVWSQSICEWQVFEGVNAISSEDTHELEYLITPSGIHYLVAQEGGEIQLYSNSGAGWADAGSPIPGQFNHQSFGYDPIQDRCYLVVNEGSLLRVAYCNVPFTSWQYLSSDLPISTGFVGQLGINEATGEIIVANNDNVVAKVYAWTGASWDQLGFDIAIGSTGLPLSIEFNNVTGIEYLAIRNHLNAGKLDVYAYDGTDWELAGSACQSIFSGQHAHLLYNDTDGFMYVLFRDGGDNDFPDGKLSCKKYDGDWEYVGEFLFSIGRSSELDFVISELGELYVGYKSGYGGESNVVTFQSGEWVDLNSNSLTASTIRSTDLAFHPDGRLFLADANNNGFSEYLPQVEVFECDEQCDDLEACNFDPFSTENTSCSYPGCTDDDAWNYDPDAICGAFDLCILDCEGDFDASGNIDTADLLIFLQIFGTDCQ